MLLRGVGHIVNYGAGFAAESRQYLKEKKNHQGQSDGAAPNEPPPYSEEDPERDSGDWDLDDATDDVDKTRAEATVIDQGGALTMITSAPPNITVKPLPCPVILPQRSPRHRSRGFVRAYAPLLGECSGIDQTQFITFLEEFDQAIKVNPVWDVINVAAFVGTIGAPFAIGIPVAFAVQFAANTAKEMQRRYRTNAYLDQVNEKQFKPRGLYCMVITYKPSQREDKVVRIDYDKVAADRSTLAEQSKEKKGKRFGSTQAGRSGGELSIPECAPLEYPGLSAQVSSELSHSSSKTSQSSESAAAPQFLSYRAYMADYLDRRRQAKFAAQHPTDPLASLPKKPFASTHADPNHPMYHHGPINMITSGRVDLWKGKREERVKRAEKELGRPLTEAEKYKVGYDRGFITPAAYARRIIGQDVLYLVICNLPNENELEKLAEQEQQM